MQRAGIGVRIDRDRSHPQALGGAGNLRTAISPRFAIRTEENMIIEDITQAMTN